ncbi:hypothetical protein V5O48_009064 [Marasmius crinis-equi]|uniref:Uncharacterized protein n=1 Tax=Marasmius crinis-equi TaxID=585013 RepID=A0ABR3FC55_9AGAR
MAAPSPFTTAEPEFRRLELKGILERDWLQEEYSLAGTALKEVIRQRAVFREETLVRLSSESAELSSRLTEME